MVFAVQTQQPSPLGSELRAVSRRLWVGKQVLGSEAMVLPSRDLSE